MNEPINDGTLIEAMPVLPIRRAESHKGDFGHVLVIGGSLGMAGAAALAGMSALRSGAGLVTVACPRETQPQIAGYEPSYMTLALDESSNVWENIAGHSATVLALGPGLGQSPWARNLVSRIITTVEKPMVLDADALNIIAADGLDVSGRKSATVVTPHPGELSRWMHLSTKSIQADRTRHALEFARKHRVVLLLKGHQTIITDGHRYAINHTGNPGMSTGGTGDVLTGICAGMLAQGWAPFDAARLAAHVHGLAGDIAVSQGHEASLIASDLIKFLPFAFRRIHSNE